MDLLRDGALIGWLGFLATAVGGVLGYLALTRRKLSVAFQPPSFVAAPMDDEEISVTVGGKSMDRPVYVVPLDLKAAGNRDVAMHADTEYMQVDATEGIEIVTVRISSTGLAKVETIENTEKRYRIKFDLLKKGEAIRLHLFVKSEKELAYTNPAKLFPVAIQIKDVQKVRLATERSTLWSLIPTVLIMSALLIAVAFVHEAIGTYKLWLADEAGHTVAVTQVVDAGLKVCRTSSDLWTEASCVVRSIPELAALKPVPPPQEPFFVPTMSTSDRLALLGLLASALLISASGVLLIKLGIHIVGRLWRSRS